MNHTSIAHFWNPTWTESQQRTAIIILMIMLLKLYLALMVINQLPTVKCKMCEPSNPKFAFFSPLSFTLLATSMYYVLTFFSIDFDSCVLKLSLLLSNPIQEIIGM